MLCVYACVCTRVCASARAHASVVVVCSVHMCGYGLSAASLPIAVPAQHLHAQELKVVEAAVNRLYFRTALACERPPPHMVLTAPACPLLLF